MDKLTDYIEGLPKKQLHALKDCIDIIKYETWPREHTELLHPEDMWTILQWNSSLMSWSIIPESVALSRCGDPDEEYLIHANEIVVYHSEKVCKAILSLLPSHPLYFLSAHSLFRNHISPAQQTMLEIIKQGFGIRIEEWT